MGPKPWLSILISARRDSKYLAKFLFGLLESTEQPDAVEVLVMLNESDTWNSELVSYFSRLTLKGRTPRIHFMSENLGLGRAGLHEYFNTLYKRSKGDWIIYFCEDHFITMQWWDSYVLAMIEERKLDPNRIWSLIPKFDNAGAMNQILSRGYCEALGGVVGHHGWIDSFINDVNHLLPPDRIIRFDDEMFHDFTHDWPNPMSGAANQSIITPKARSLPAFKSMEYEKLVRADAKKLNEAIERGL